MNLSGLTLEQLVTIKNDVESLIYNFSDGFFYICKVRSYGKNWTETKQNTHTTSELCNQYDGCDGIVTIYTNNPDCKIYSYGGVYYIKSQDDLKKWEYYQRLKNIVPEIEKEWEEWDNIENIPFRQRTSYFKPIYSKEDLEEYRKELENFVIDFEDPKILGNSDEY
jgi:hypothetical protein